MPSIICFPMFMVGSRLVIGSWNTIAIWRPFISRRISGTFILRMSHELTLPSSFMYLNSIDPLFTTAFFARIPMIPFVVTDFPEPDSPTIATVCPSRSSRLTPRIAFTIPAAVLNDMERLFTLSIFSASVMSHFLHFRIERFAQTVGKHIEAQHEQCKHETRRYNLIRVRRKAVECVADERSERTLRNRNSQTDERKKRFCKYRRGDAEHCLRNDLPDYIRKDFTENNREASRSERARCKNVFAFLEIKHLGTRDAAHADPFCYHESKNNSRDSRLHH